jgi:hypothetical protein
MTSITSIPKNEPLSHAPLVSLIFIFSLWLLALGVSLWPACLNSQPPIHDAIGYASKAKNVWESILSMRQLDLLSTQPTSRPPGTVLVSYPFGYTNNTQGFYFRSVFIPCALFGFAAFLTCVVGRWDNSKTKIFPLAISVCATTLPLFYQFQLGSFFVGYWGLVDGFIGSASAIAMAFLLVRIRKCQRATRFFGLCIASACIYIKPAGIFVFVICAGMYLLLQSIWVIREEKKFVQNIALDFSLVALAACLLLPAFLSPYLGNENFASAQVAVGILKSEASQKLSLYWSLNAIFHLLGWIPAFLLTLAVGAGLFSIIRLRGGERVDVLILLFFAFVWFSCGLAFLLNSSLSQVRYTFPFWLPAIICITAIAAHAKNLICDKPVATLLVGLIFIQTAGLLDQLLNYQDKNRPSILAGWNTRSKDIPELIPFYAWLSSQSQKNKEKKLIFYNAAQDQTSTILASAITYDAMVLKRFQQGGFFLKTRSPVNWKRPSGLYVQELSDVNFIMVPKSPIMSRGSSPSNSLEKLQNELTKNPKELTGLTQAAIGDNIVIYEVTDRNKYLNWLYSLFPAT